MGTSPETFNQVKNILRKLDQSIDSARDQRLSKSTASANPGPGSGPGTLVPNGGPQIGGLASTAKNPDPTERPGRARPMLRPPARPNASGGYNGAVG